MFDISRDKDLSNKEACTGIFLLADEASGSVQRVLSPAASPQQVGHHTVYVQLQIWVPSRNPPILVAFFSSVPTSMMWYRTYLTIF